MEILPHLQAAEEYIFSRLGNDLRVATPLGLGKPNQLINRLYERALDNSNISLTLFTALSLDIPDPKNDIEKRFVAPFLARHFGDDYPRLRYLADLRRNSVPSNIVIHEFYYQAGSMLSISNAQKNYISLNYTHVAQEIFRGSINVIVQLVAWSKDKNRYSLSCNPDLTLDIYDIYKKNGKRLLVIGVVHPDLPFLGGDAEVDPNFFDAIVHTPEVRHKLFSLPKAPLDPTDYAIGMHASRLLCDDGTLQIGIGSLSDAVVHATLLRQRENSIYRKVLLQLDPPDSPQSPVDLHMDPFIQGLYGTSEMLMDGFMHLRKAGILKRDIFDRDENARRYMHGAFFLGSKEFYNWLKNLSGEDFDGLSMTRVSKVNDLYDEHEYALRRQRKNARFFNTCMQVDLLGGAAAETLENANVVSGVGGQYNFVAMSHELPDSHSVLMLKSTRHQQGKRLSNIVWSRNHLTIPRHLRDIVVTEYGIAALRGQSDENCIKQLLQITDSQFQGDLLATAKKYGKLAADWKIPKHARQNTPERIFKIIESVKDKNMFPRFPFGSDFSLAEERLQTALLKLKEQNPLQLLRTLFAGLKKSPTEYSEELKRMQLDSPKSPRESILRQLLLGSL